MLPLAVTTRLASPFWFLYAFCGMTDIADGFVARKLKAETKTGELLDSIADIVFVVCCICKLPPFLSMPSWLWLIVVMIVVIKIENQSSAWVAHKRLVFPHTFANKLTGLMLFVSIPFIVCFEMPMLLIADSVVAMYAAVHEGRRIGTRQV